MCCLCMNVCMLGGGGGNVCVLGGGGGKHLSECVMLYEKWKVKSETELLLLLLFICCLKNGCLCCEIWKMVQRCLYAVATAVYMLFKNGWNWNVAAYGLDWVRF